MMRHHQHSEFHFRHALFALQGPDGYVEALMESARESGAKHAATAHRLPCERTGEPLFATAPRTDAPARYRHH
jgi:hypothetical protein